MGGHFDEDFEKTVEAGYERLKAKKQDLNGCFDPEEDQPNSTRKLKIKHVYDKLLEDDKADAAAEFYECEGLHAQKDLADEHLEDMDTWY